MLCVPDGWGWDGAISDADGLQQLIGLAYVLAPGTVQYSDYTSLVNTPLAKTPL